MTNFCCETTARSAFVKNFEVVFVSDANNSDNIQNH